MIENEKKIIYEISSLSILKAILIVLIFVFAYFILDILGVIFFALIITSVAEPIITKLKKYKIPRILAGVLIYFFGILIFGFILYLIFPVLAFEVKQIAVLLPTYIEGIKIQFGTGFISDDILTNLQNYLTDVAAILSRSFGEILLGTIRGLVYVVSVIIISLYLSIRERGIEQFLELVTPESYKIYILDLWKRTKKKLAHWFQSYLFLSFLIGVLVFLGLSLIGVRYALLLAIISAVFELLPVIGPIFAATVAILIVLFESPILAFIVFLFYIIIHQIESHIIIPLFMTKAVGVDPVLIILALLIGNKLAGIVGILFAVPLAAIFTELFKDIIEKKYLVFGNNKNKSLSFVSDSEKQIENI